MEQEELIPGSKVHLLQEELIPSSKMSLHILSDFSDADCGEPIRSQQLVIEFTPIPGLDDEEELKNKCVELWDYIDNHLKIEEALESPSELTKDTVSENSDAPSTTVYSAQAMEWLEKQDGQPEAFATKYEKLCGAEYLEKECDVEHIGGGNTNKRMTPSKNARKPGLHAKMKPIAAKLCAEMDKWDSTHPKSMDPPSRVPTDDILEN